MRVQNWKAGSQVGWIRFLEPLLYAAFVVCLFV